MQRPSYLNFDNSSYEWKKEINYRQEPEKYKVGKGEQGVLICEPYKSEIVPLWRFKTPPIAEESSEQIYKLFLKYLDKNEFVGADMARKFLQMGFTRSRRYANYKGGRKYDSENNYQQLERGTGDTEKILCADIFYKKWQEAENHPPYAQMKADWKKRYG